MHKNRCSRGLTLMEIVVSSIIIAITVMGLANLFVASKKYVLHSRSRMSGGELGRVFLDPLQSGVSQQNWTSSSNCLNTNTACPGAISLDKINYTPNYTVDNVSNTSLRRVKVMINWTEPTQ